MESLKATNVGHYVWSFNGIK